ncbi:survival motor neuron protein-like [Gigantopelta aegis]|uniref:survival motor neuron protein-like n=1 Tax=Gigantopelta aegis TaxID=1735272 RepID=UPI001B88DD8A|nr:survival motor neuron protein-like [Gigantopelta aegis]
MAGAEDGLVIFNRNQQSEEDNDMWDDSALISAYDKAVSAMKAKLAERNGDEIEIPEAQTLTETEKMMKKKKKKKNRPKKKKQKWNVGDFCRAVFSEDGLIYTGQITDIDYDKGTCVVKYKNYGNEEEHKLSDILLPSVKIKRTGIGHSSASESDVLGQSTSQPGSGAANHNPAWQGTGFLPPQQPFQQMPQPPYNMPQATPFPGFGASFQQRMPMMPPPPPPPQMMEDVCDDESEALSGMLIAWYMSGYHTGYYQGLRQGRSQSGAAVPGVPR